MSVLVLNRFINYFYVMNKNELRAKYKSLRQKLSDDVIESLSLAIANQILKLKIWDYDFYHLFLPIEEQKEVNTEYILNILSGKDKNIVVSKSDFKTLQMTHYLLTDSTTIKKNPYNIPEPTDGIEIQPEKIDVVFVPLLAYDREGNRVGYGKGFYDRFLSACSQKTLKIGLSFFEPEVHINNTNDTDLPLNFCITPKNIFEF